MKYTLLALLSATAAVAQTPMAQPSAGTAGDSSCTAAYIVDQCLTDENGKLANCAATDYNCQCYAYQAIATCYNNCPSDPRASSAQSQVLIYCAQASAHPSATTAKPAATASMTEEAAASGSGSPVTTGGSKPTVTLHNNKAGSSSFTSDNPQSTGSAAELVRNTGGALLAVAGVIAAVF